VVEPEILIVVERPMRESSTSTVVWTQEFEFTLTPSGSQAGKEEEMKVKGRCTACWGGLALSGEGENHVVSHIKCYVCKKKLAGEDAADEYRRVLKEAVHNAFRTSVGLPPTHEGGPFVGKSFPHLLSLTEDEVRERIASRVEPTHPRKWLTRRDFPLGTAAYLYLQARLLVAAVNDMYASHDEAIIKFRKAKPTDDPRQNERDLYQRLGSTMTRGMMSAFACELLMKAVSLTVSDKARKTHDLLCLYKCLPDSSRQRLEIDFPDIANVMREGRHRFGEWRYFESGKKEALTAIIDTSLEQALGKVARVMLDEAEIVGLRGGIDMKARRDVTDHGDKTEVHHQFHATMKGAENPQVELASPEEA